MAITQCSNCDGKVSTRAAACPHCDHPVEPPIPEITCTDCGEDFAASLTVCPGCGGPVEAPEDTKELSEAAPLAAAGPDHVPIERAAPEIESVGSSPTDLGADRTFVRCPECGREVSRLAVSCPQCGRPMKEESAANNPPAPLGGSGLETSYWRLGAFLVVSAVASASVFQFGPPASSDGLFSALSHYFLPGFFFGVAVAIATRLKPVLTPVYATLNALIYAIATWVVFLWGGLLWEDYFGLTGVLNPALSGAVAGVFGALMVVLLTGRFFNRHAPLRAVKWVLLAGFLAGALLGVSEEEFGADLERTFFTGWLVWQVSVGLLVHRGLRIAEERKHLVASFW